MIMKWLHVKHQSTTFWPTILGSTRRLAGGLVKEITTHRHDFVMVSSLIGFDCRDERY